MSDNDHYATFALAIADPAICERFWSHVNKLGPVHPTLGSRCWLWTGNVTGRKSKNYPVNSQHGQFTYRFARHQHHAYAHRFAWGIAHGPIPMGVQVLHHCDVPPCVNHSHHFLGTPADNMRDAARKHRLTVPRVKKLSLLDRLTIQASPLRDVDLAHAYGVSKTCVHYIRRGRFVGSGLSINQSEFINDGMGVSEHAAEVGR